MFVVSPIAERASLKAEPPAYFAPSPAPSMDKKDPSEENLSLVFHRRLATPWQDQQASHVQFSQKNEFLLVLCRWRDPTALSNIRKAHDVLVYDVATREKLYLDRISQTGSVGYSVGLRGAAIGPIITETHERTSSLSSLGLRSKPKSSRSKLLPLIVCHGQMSNNADWSPTLDIVDLYKKERKRSTPNVRIQGPLTWSPDGDLLAGLDFADPTKVCLFQARAPNIPRIACLPGHLADITELAFMPDGKGLLSLASDGVGRLVSISPSTPGTLLNSFHVPTARYSASALQISPDGRTVGSIWGRLIVVWYPDTNRVMSYELEASRPGADLLPLAISPKCDLLACRSNSGIEVCDFLTGQRRGSAKWKNNGVDFATSASFHSGAGGLMLAVGTFNGKVTIYNVTDEAPIELDGVQMPAEVPGAMAAHEVEDTSLNSFDSSRGSQGSWL